MTWQVLHGESADVLPRFPADSVDAIICDPPAWIDFMGKQWDSTNNYGDFVKVMAECERVLKPGGYCVVWGLPRTSWMTAAGMDAGGIEIRDRIHHVFGSGMPHARDLSKAVDEHLLGGKDAARAARPVTSTYRVGVLERFVTRIGEHATIDHIVPYARGGTDAIKNIQLLCRQCNIAKGDGPLIRKRRRSNPPAWMGGWS